ncbi:hypothetical protein Tco_0827665 [Tanacetum coccineum]
MAAISNVPRLVDKKGGSYSDDGPFKPKTTKGADKPECQWTPDERRVVNQDQHLKRIIISCPPNDIMESVISCETAKSTWTDLVNNFEGPSNTKENMIMDLKLEYQTFKAKPFESLSKKLTTTLYNKVLVVKTFDWDEEEVFDDEEMTQVKVLMALVDDELSMGKNHARNGEWIDITMKKINIFLSMDEDFDWQTYLKYINIDLKKLASLDYDHEMLLKSKDWIERNNLDSKLLNFNTGRIIVPESQVVNECLQLTKAPSDPESSKESGSKL